MIAIEMTGSLKSRRFVDNWRTVRLVIDYARLELKKLGYKNFFECSESRESRSWIAESCFGDRKSVV